MATALTLAFIATPSSATATGRWVAWPLTGSILRLPVIPFPNWKPGHRGIDLAVGLGADIRAPATGTVSWVGSVNHIASITVVDRYGYRHTVLPIDTQLSVGDHVTRGEVLGTVATSDHCIRTCLHWGIRKGRAYIDPRWLAPPLIYRLHR
ncbi:MAG: hypothetical protein RL410_272 [Actinomycetota bacterium]|jgi:murein DD-endopeptidase MepM/ murein hydrolase activator NlpD